ncbi:MAG TPA: mercury methylation corrinoid protein HgcA [Bacillota bacterium]
METKIWPITGRLTAANRWDHVLARCGYRRGDHRVRPGLYALGRPTPESPVFVTANYTLSFDALRSALAGRDAYILALDTKGINVWCAAGKGTFGTVELIRRVKVTRLAEVVSHRTIILPQLGAAGVSAQAIENRLGFRVEYGPVRAGDLPEYLKTHQATPEMRRVTFTLAERAVLIPVEVLHLGMPLLTLAALGFFGVLPLVAFGGVAALLAGAAVFPILLPWLPSKDYSVKGWLLGLVAVAPFAYAGAAAAVNRGGPWWAWLEPLALMLGLPAITAYLSLNFTGATPWTSKTGVKKEIARYVPIMIGLAASGVLALGLGIALNLIKAR